ncbi:hypothetical protein EDB87DRAFT_780756 [Lactarius vividus]|nr:hypothetical protein EDB87DRAFT_780756 [Lactarius vividus]
MYRLQRTSGLDTSFIDKDLQHSIASAWIFVSYPSPQSFSLSSMRANTSQREWPSINAGNWSSSSSFPVELRVVYCAHNWCLAYSNQSGVFFCNFSNPVDSGVTTCSSGPGSYVGLMTVIHGFNISRSNAKHAHGRLSVSQSCGRIETHGACVRTLGPAEASPRDNFLTVMPETSWPSAVQHIGRVTRVQGSRVTKPRNCIRVSRSWAPQTLPDHVVGEARFSHTITAAYLVAPFPSRLPARPL